MKLIQTVLCCTVYRDCLAAASRFVHRVVIASLLSGKSFTFYAADTTN